MIVSITILLSIDVKSYNISLAQTVESFRFCSVKSNQMRHSIAQKSIKNIKVSATHYEPFMYRDDLIKIQSNRGGDGKFHNGIEYKLIKTIAEKEHLTLSIKIFNRKSVENNDLKSSE